MLPFEAKWHHFLCHINGVAFPCGAERIAQGLRTCRVQGWSMTFSVLNVDTCMTDAFNLFLIKLHVSYHSVLSTFLNFSLGSAGAMDSIPFSGTH